MNYDNSLTHELRLIYVQEVEVGNGNVKFVELQIVLTYKDNHKTYIA